MPPPNKVNTSDAGKTALRKSLETFKTATDADAGATTAFKVASEIADVHPTMYQYFSESDFEFIDRLSDGSIKKKKTPNGRQYLTPDKFDDAETAKSKLQLDNKGLSDAERARYRIEVDTSMVQNDLELPYAWDYSTGKGLDQLEPLTRHNKGADYGEGGARQLTNADDYNISDTVVYDGVLKRYLTSNEVERLLNSYQN